MDRKYYFLGKYSISRKIRLVQILSLLFIYFEISSCAEFNKNYTGVVYGAYIKHREYGQIPEWKTYTWVQIKCMLEVISEKFSKIATYGVGANPEKTYERYASYYDSNKQAYAAEAAASINRNRNKTVLTVWVGVYEADTLNQTDIEARVALGSAAKANELYPGTAQGLIFTQTDIATSVHRANLTLEAIQIYKNEAKSFGLKVGTRQNCSLIFSHSKNKSSDALKNIQRKIIAESDFIICSSRPEILQSNESDPEYAFLKVKTDLLSLRESLKKINPDLEVMGETGWPSKGKHPWQNIENLEKYWKIVNEFGVEHNFQMWMFEAFDSPWKVWTPSAPYFGWWKLTNNSKIHLREGYLENIQGGPLLELDPGEAFPIEVISTKNPWVYAAVVNGSLIIIFFVIMTIRCIIRANNRKKRLTKRDLEEFRLGIPRDSKEGNDTAQNLPYDTSLEILKDSIKIYELLGSGQYGKVYRATFENADGEVIEVALKIPESDCPKYVLKSFLSEIKLLTFLGKHENIVPIRGAYTTEARNGVVYIATEYCCMGSLQNYLRKCRANHLDSDHGYTFANVLDLYENVDDEPTSSNNRPEVISDMDMVRWSYQIACGMEFLEINSVVHNDLASRNVVLTSNLNAKITDFGLSRKLYEYTSYVKTQQEPLPWRWMAIESLKRLEFSSKSDCWSFGIVLWEIYSMGDIPYPGLSWSPDFADSLERGMRMNSPPHASPEIYEMMTNCWHNDPKERPTFTELKQFLSRILDACDSTYSYFD